MKKFFLVNIISCVEFHKLTHPLKTRSSLQIATMIRNERFKVESLRILHKFCAEFTTKRSSLTSQLCSTNFIQTNFDWFIDEYDPDLAIMQIIIYLL